MALVRLAISPYPHLHPLLSGGQYGGLRPVLDLQFLHDMVDVRFDGFDAYRKFGGNGPVGCAIDEQAQHFALAVGK